MADEPTKPREPVADTHAILEALLEGAPFALQVVDAGGRTVLVNRAFRALFGSPPAAEQSVFEDEALEKRGMLAHIRHAFAGETVRVPAEWYDLPEPGPAEARERRAVGIEVTLFPLRDARGEVAHVAVCAKDETAQLELRKSTRACGHDLNNLLSVILSYSDILLSELAPGAEIAVELREIRKAGGRAAELAGKMLALGRPPESE